MYNKRTECGEITVNHRILISLDKFQIDSFFLRQAANTFNDHAINVEYYSECIDMTFEES